MLVTSVLEESYAGFAAPSDVGKEKVTDRWYGDQASVEGFSTGSHTHGQAPAPPRPTDPTRWQPSACVDRPGKPWPAATQIGYLHVYAQQPDSAAEHYIRAFEAGDKAEKKADKAGAAKTDKSAAATGSAGKDGKAGSCGKGGCGKGSCG